MLNNDGESSASRTLSRSKEKTGYNVSMTVTDIISCTNSLVDGNGTLEGVIENRSIVAQPSELAAPLFFGFEVAVVVGMTDVVVLRQVIESAAGKLAG